MNVTSAALSSLASFGCRRPPGCSRGSADRLSRPERPHARRPPRRRRPAPRPRDSCSNRRHRGRRRCARTCSGSGYRLAAAAPRSPPSPRPSVPAQPQLVWVRHKGACRTEQALFGAASPDHFESFVPRPSCQTARAAAARSSRCARLCARRLATARQSFPLTGWAIRSRPIPRQRCRRRPAPPPWTAGSAAHGRTRGTRSPPRRGAATRACPPRVPQSW